MGVCERGRRTGWFFGGDHELEEMVDSVEKLVPVARGLDAVMGRCWRAMCWCGRDGGGWLSSEPEG